MQPGHLFGGAAAFHDVNAAAAMDVQVDEARQQIAFDRAAGSQPRVYGLDAAVGSQFQFAVHPAGFGQDASLQHSVLGHRLSSATKS